MLGDVTNTEQEASAPAKKQEPAHVAGLSMDDDDAQDMTVSDFLKAKRDEEVSGRGASGIFAVRRCRVRLLRLHAPIKGCSL